MNFKSNEQAAINCAFKRSKLTGNIASGYEFLELWARNHQISNHGAMQAEYEKMWCDFIGVDYKEAVSS